MTCDLHDSETDGERDRESLLHHFLICGSQCWVVSYPTHIHKHSLTNYWNNWNHFWILFK